MDHIMLMSDPKIAMMRVEENGDPLVDVRDIPGLVLDGRLADPLGAYARLRTGVADRLVRAQESLPSGLRLLVVEGYRPLRLQVRYFEDYARELQAANPDWPWDHVHVQASRSLSPPEIGPHVCGAAVDLTLCGSDGREVAMGSELNASPEASDDRCYTESSMISATARENRRILCESLTAAGLVNYPTEWWHWSYGDRYWAVVTGATAACYRQLDWP